MKKICLSPMTVKTILLASTLGIAMSACAQTARSGADTWKEEALLHDGRKLMVERFQTYGGRHEVGQPSAVTEQAITFMLPSSGRSLSWTSEFGPDLGRTDFNPLALHILGDTPYVVAEPNLCLSYNKWGRPNPPYVVFKHDGTAWQRIPLEQLPAQFTTFNLVISYGSRQARENALRPLGYVSAEGVREDNSTLRQPEYKTILREPLPEQRILSRCEEMIHYKCGWISPHGDFGRKFMDRTCK